MLAARVRAAAPKLGYRPNYLARNLRRQRTSLWLLIISDIENVFFTSVARGVEDAAVGQPVLGRAVQRRRGRGQGGALRRAGPRRAGRRGDRLAPQRPDRHRVRCSPPRSRSSSSTASSTTRSTPSRRTPAAAPRPPPSTCSPRVGPARAASPDRARRRRRTCAASVTRTRSCRVDPDVAVVHRPFTIDGGRAAAAHLLDQSRPPDALFVGNAALGLGVLQELRARNLRPGHDVGLICFDDAPWAPFIDPPISVVSQPAYRMGAQAAALLVERIGGAAHPPRRIVLGTDLIVRESSLRHGTR